MNTRINHWAITLLALFFSLHLHAQSPESAYTVKSGDWLSTISEKAYGNPHLYNRIIEGTNQKAETDRSYRKIARANDLQIGQKLWIPAAAPSNNMTGVPVTNCDIRLWYNFQVVAIGKINEKWMQDGIDLETRAHKAFEMRHEARVNARFMMQNPEEVAALQARDQEKYGNPNGPTFEYLLDKNMGKGMSREAALQSIIDSSSRTDSGYNKDCQ